MEGGPIIGKGYWGYCLTSGGPLVSAKDDRVEEGWFGEETVWRLDVCGGWFGFCCDWFTPPIVNGL